MSVKLRQAIQLCSLQRGGRALLSLTAYLPFMLSFSILCHDKFFSIDYLSLEGQFFSKLPRSGIFSNHLSKDLSAVHQQVPGPSL